LTFPCLPSSSGFKVLSLILTRLSLNLSIACSQVFLRFLLPFTGAGSYHSARVRRRRPICRWAHAQTSFSPHPYLSPPDSLSIIFVSGPFFFSILYSSSSPAFFELLSFRPLPFSYTGSLIVSQSCATYSFLPLAISGAHRLKFYAPILLCSQTFLYLALQPDLCLVSCFWVNEAAH